METEVPGLGGGLWGKAGVRAPTGLVPVQSSAVPGLAGYL